MRAILFLTACSTACAVSASAMAGGADSFTLNGAEEPEIKAWTEPASVAFTSNNGGKDSWAVNLAGKYENQLSDNSTSKLVVRFAVEKNTQLKKEVENYGASVGYKFYWTDARDGPTPDLEAWHLANEFSLGITDKAVFPDAKAICTAAPLPPECTEQRETSLRAQLQVQPYRHGWDKTFHYEDSTHTKLKGQRWTRSFTPVLSLFYDEILDAKADAAGARADGGVTGLKLSLSGAASPRVTNYRLVLSAKLQLTETLSRSVGRRDGFQSSATLLKLGADYEFGPRSFENGGNKWVPSFGIAYTKGDDPLAGKTDLDNTVLAFKLTYRN
ncbi:hypothetical protein DMC25_22245 [Caulobacter sp. D4A]|uniref:hypothetical protein n=1 Tax=unclassified Caulobacter TaxID=2648921 RepID=UPI000D728BD3|nr:MULTISPECIES: hypothetical protein [unclassified Caulobacter]PXA78743.1 hypothetical protein DMC25_22245 [Caulobacter sp. D4A]PXA88726.1 hypothetical protein DMC18_18635 [Caulobacter sp. D5]